MLLGWLSLTAAAVGADRVAAPHGINIGAAARANLLSRYGVGTRDNPDACPQEPVPDGVWEMVPDGKCRKATDGDPAQGQLTFAYKVNCTWDGGVVLEYLDVVDKDAPAFCNRSHDPTSTIPPAYCFPIADLGLAGCRFTCGKHNATLLGWTEEPPDVKQITDQPVMSTAGRPQLTTQTVFPPAFPFPPTSKDSCATLYISTPYDSNSTFSAGIKALPQAIDPIVYGAIGTPHTLVGRLLSDRPLRYRYSTVT